MQLFHGSRTGGIEILEPRQADHDRPYVYMTTNRIVALFYLCNAVGFCVVGFLLAMLYGGWM